MSFFRKSHWITLFFRQSHRRYAIVFLCFIICLSFCLMKPDGMGIYMEDTEDERPLFNFGLRPWKVETSIRTNKACYEKQYDVRWGMVFVVKSTISNFSRRKAIRYTWGNVKMYGEIMLQTIFILGNTSDRAITEQIDLENHIHGDILQFDFPDTANYLPEKVLAGMQWAKDLPINWFYTSIDDDIVVNLAKLAKYIDRLIIERINSSNGRINFPKIPIVCIYSYQNLDLPNRETDSKWYMPTKDFPGRYWPTYCRGGAYTTTSYMAKRLFEVSRRTSRLYLDDVWITGFMRLKVERTNDNIVAAPGSRLRERMLHKNIWFSDSIVHHFWGDITGVKVKVPYSLVDSWNQIYQFIKAGVTCLEHFNSEDLFYDDIIAIP